MMVKKSWIIGSFVIAGALLGVLAIGGNSLINQYAQKEVEQSLSDGTGLKVDCAKADVNLFAQNIKMMDIRFSNLEGFPSTYIFQLGSMEVQAERLNAKPLIFKTMIIKDVKINIDVKFSKNPAQPENLMQMNIQEMQQKANNRGSTKKSSNPKQDLIIQQLLFKNIQVNINAQLPLQTNSVKEQFQIQEISLMDLNNENLPQKLSTALQEKILVEEKKRLSQKNPLPLNQILQPLMDLKPQNSSPLSLPKKPSLPLPSQQPKPQNSSPLSLPKKPSLPLPSQQPKPQNSSPLSLPKKPSLPLPSQQPKPQNSSPLSLPKKPSLPLPSQQPKPQNSSPLSLPKKPSLPLPSQQPKPPSPPKLPALPSLP